MRPGPPAGDPQLDEVPEPEARATAADERLEEPDEGVHRREGPAPEAGFARFRQAPFGQDTRR